MEIFSRFLKMLISKMSQLSGLFANYPEMSKDAQRKIRKRVREGLDAGYEVEVVVRNHRIW
jgi:hypothetical protein